MEVVFGPKTQAFCLDHPAFRQLFLCPDCNETIAGEGDAKDDCPKYCECDEQT